MTHIVSSSTIGVRDVVYTRQHQSSPLSATDIENYVKDIGDQRFSDLKSQSTAPLKYKDKVSMVVLVNFSFKKLILLIYPLLMTLSTVCMVTHSGNYFSLCLSDGFVEGFRSDGKKR